MCSPRSTCISLAAGSNVYFVSILASENLMVFLKSTQCEPTMRDQSWITWGRPEPGVPEVSGCFFFGEVLWPYVTFYLSRQYFLKTPRRKKKDPSNMRKNQRAAHLFDLWWTLRFTVFWSNFERFPRELSRDSAQHENVTWSEHKITVTYHNITNICLQNTIHKATMLTNKYEYRSLHGRKSTQKYRKTYDL